MAEAVELPIVDLASSDRNASACSIRKACTECGFFYLINHGVEESLLQKVLEGNKMFFSLCLEEKMKLARKNHRGYTPLYAEKLDTSTSSREVLPGWRSIMEGYYEQVMNAGKRLVKLVALALSLDESFFYDLGAFNPPDGYLRLLHYPGELGSSDEEIYGASAHSDYGMITLLATDGIHGLQEYLTCSFNLAALAFCVVVDANVLTS
ncbi:1-aminocyclopropane-1-carboxylate oxidase-like [Dorcoceras hygrometricum]|uniref:1-aminocyclopropane-1-carboxylate oxidase-like n=1 Tax=Dorcoceras hygrometricum TaxID=472368 RepID=A0A2Z7ABJ9_9LAMI|nr:1-aminocyclopropane-1-carboxylate oxidase-like [Dorcoceras hygrometricum]